MHNQKYDPHPMPILQELLFHALPFLSLFLKFACFDCLYHRFHLHILIESLQIIVLARVKESDLYALHFDTYIKTRNLLSLQFILFLLHIRNISHSSSTGLWDKH